MPCVRLASVFIVEPCWLVDVDSGWAVAGVCCVVGVKADATTDCVDTTVDKNIAAEVLEVDVVTVVVVVLVAVVVVDGHAMGQDLHMPRHGARDVSRAHTSRNVSFLSISWQRGMSILLQQLSLGGIGLQSVALEGLYCPNGHVIHPSVPPPHAAPGYFPARHRKETCFFFFLGVIVWVGLV